MNGTAAGGEPRRGAAADRVTVVVMTRDRAAELRRTLPRHEAPVIVVDNGSRDGTVRAARGLGATVVELPEDRGAPARNVGARLAGTPYVAFADDDSWWAPGMLERGAALLDAHPAAGLLAARVLVGPGERLDPVSARMERAELGRPYGLPGPAVLGFLACSVIVRRSAFLGVGGFSPLLEFYGEEELLALDLAGAGWGLSYVPELVVHHHPARTGRRPGLRRRREIRNRLLTAWLRRPLGTAARMGAAAAAGDADHRRALVEALWRLPAVARRRRPLPREVERAAALLAAPERAGAVRP